MNADSIKAGHLKLYEKGVQLRNQLDYLYIIRIRAYEIDIGSIKKRVKAGDESHGNVVKAKWRNKKTKETIDVSLKYPNPPVSPESATNFLAEELGIRWVKTLLKFGTSNSFLGQSMTLIGFRPTTIKL